MDAVLVFQPAHLQHEKLRLGDFGNHPDQFFLHELVRGDRAIVELFALLCVVERRVVASHGRADRAPADAVARLIQTTKAALSGLRRPGNRFSAGILQSVIERLGRHRCAQRILAVNVLRLESRRAFFNEKAADFIVFALRPDQRDIGDRAVGDPHFFAVEHVTRCPASRRA